MIYLQAMYSISQTPTEKVKAQIRDAINPIEVTKGTSPSKSPGSEKRGLAKGKGRAVLSPLVNHIRRSPTDQTQAACKEQGSDTHGKVSPKSDTTTSINTPPSKSDTPTSINTPPSKSDMPTSKSTPPTSNNCDESSTFPVTPDNETLQQATSNTPTAASNQAPKENEVQSSQSNTYLMVNVTPRRPPGSSYPFLSPTLLPSSIEALLNGDIFNTSYSTTPVPFSPSQFLCSPKAASLLFSPLSFNPTLNNFLKTPECPSSLAHLENKPVPDYSINSTE